MHFGTAWEVKTKGIPKREINHSVFPLIKTITLLLWSPIDQNALRLFKCDIINSEKFLL